MKNLFIVESPNKVQTISKYLGENFDVLASVGHIYKLKTTGEYGLGINLQTWEPYYQIDPSKKEIVNKLKKLAKKSNKILIATDPDREGESIAGNIVEALNISNKYERIVFNEITKSAILEAINNPTKLDENLINAQKTRRMLDRVIGFRLSNLLRQKIKNTPAKPSAGRVQSIALKLIVERENLINNFVPIEYSKIIAELTNGIKVEFFYDKPPIPGEKSWIPISQSNKIFNSLKKKLNIINIERKIITGSKSHPLELDEVIRKASAKYGFSALKTENITQKLYEIGYITYPRTDSKRFSMVFIDELKKYVIDTFGEKYLDIASLINLNTNKKNANKNIQDAHEAIRPTSISLHPSNLHDLTSSELNVYKIIYSETLKVALRPPIYNITNYILKDLDNWYNFKVSEKDLKFNGSLIAGFDDIQTTVLNLDWNEGDVVDVLNYVKTNHSSQPPIRYSDGKLISFLKKIGVGRPSTYGKIVSTLLKRKFIEEITGNIDLDGKVIKGKKRLKPTEFGLVVCEKITTNFSHIINEQYTATIEEELDKIALSNLDYKKMLSEFYSRLDTQIKDTFKTMNVTTLHTKEIEINCIACGKKLLQKYNRNGQPFIACSGFPECRQTFSNEAEALLGKKETRSTDVECPSCHSVKLIYKMNRKNQEFISCPNYPKCRVAFNNLEAARLGEMPSPKILGEKCPKCNFGDLVERSKKNGSSTFVGCSNFPKCRYLKNAKSEVTNIDSKENSNV